MVMARGFDCGAAHVRTEGLSEQGETRIKWIGGTGSSSKRGGERGEDAEENGDGDQEDGEEKMERKMKRGKWREEEEQQQ